MRKQAINFYYSILTVIFVACLVGCAQYPEVTKEVQSIKEKIASDEGGMLMCEYVNMTDIAIGKISDPSSGSEKDAVIIRDSLDDELYDLVKEYPNVYCTYIFHSIKKSEILRNLMNTCIKENIGMSFELIFNNRLTQYFNIDDQQLANLNEEMLKYVVESLRLTFKSHQLEILKSGKIDYDNKNVIISLGFEDESMIDKIKESREIEEESKQELLELLNDIDISGINISGIIDADRGLLFKLADLSQGGSVDILIANEEIKKFEENFQKETQESFSE